MKALGRSLAVPGTLADQDPKLKASGEMSGQDI